MSPPAVPTLASLLRRWWTTGRRAEAVGILDRGARLRWLSSAEMEQRIRDLGHYLQSAGVRPGDRVVLFSENRWEWLVADFAILAAGAVTVPLHPGLNAAQVGFILTDSDSTLSLVSTPMLTGLLREAQRDLPASGPVVVFDPPAVPDPALLTIEAAMSIGRTHAAAHPGALDATLDAVEPGDLASLIYTSGTTGEPKGVMLTHGNLASNVSACCSVFEFQSTDTGLSLLPLCHVFERTVDYCYLHAGCQVVHLADLARVADALTAVRPTVFGAVPRLYEKLYARILAGVPASRRSLFDWAVRVGVEVVRRHLDRRPVGAWLALQRLIADRLVFAKIRARLGGRIRFLISGGAPIAAELAEFYCAVGLPLLEGYGLTETAPVIATNRLDRPRPGTVGPPIPGVEVRIAADGEIQTRGPHVMQGYWRQPEKTDQVIDAEGWFSTGDIGSLDAEGYLRITDRKKELLVTALGKKIAPQPIENALKRQPLIAQAALIGDRRPYATALIVPDFEAVQAQADSLGLAGLSPADQVRHPALIAAVDEGVRRVSAGLAHWEQVRRFVLLPREFSLEEGELTPTLKIKRRVIEDHFAREIEALYAVAAPAARA